MKGSTEIVSSKKDYARMKYSIIKIMYSGGTMKASQKLSVAKQKQALVELSTALFSDLNSVGLTTSSEAYNLEEW